jgi:glycyl-tRNA synthetase
MGQSLEKEDLADVKSLIEELEIACPETGSRNWTDVKQFNLMFGTKLGASAESATELYLRPETAQGIFVNFLNVQKTGRMKLPFGIAQTGKAFRNEIVARQFIFRMREFEQMEMQFFIPPGTQKEWYAHRICFLPMVHHQHLNLPAMPRSPKALDDLVLLSSGMAGLSMFQKNTITII